jgi:hypothetical protein
MQEDLSRKQILGPPSYTLNRQTDINNRFNSRNLQKNNSRWSPEPSTGRGGPPVIGGGRSTPPVGRPTQWPHRSASPLYVSFPPPPRFNLRRCSRSVRIKSPDITLPWIHGPTELLVPPIKGPRTPSREASHREQSHSDQDTPREIDLELSNVVD